MKKGEVKMFKRHRKLRKNEVIRNLVKDVYISKDDLIYPIFVEEGENIKSEIPSMPGIFRYSIDRLSEELDELVKLGINSILLFGIPEKRMLVLQKHIMEMELFKMQLDLLRKIMIIFL